MFIEHFQEKWTPVFRPELRQNKELEIFRHAQKREKPL
ncbi:hypothetical protein AGRO_1454 [Agrobacterium sp. ATCC 31749]|nr:hypothetical protein AGRO_1454 [Agrobacterium sp. ATCC 31749]